MEQKQRDEAKLRKESSEDWETKVFMSIMDLIYVNLIEFSLSISNPLRIHGSTQNPCHRDCLLNRKTTKDNKTQVNRIKETN